jgi:hypothetical protein
MARRRFDQNNNRVDYGELLVEDPSYELDQAVGMTYSLDMEALMGIPLCLGMRGEMTSGQRIIHYMFSKLFVEQERSYLYSAM